jgi:hypothetical protein
MRQRFSLRDKISAMAPWDPNLRRRKTAESSLPRVAEQTQRLSKKTVRGSVTSGGAVNRGEGFTATRGSAGNYTVTFSPALTDIPCVVVTVTSAVVRFVAVTGVSTTAFTVNLKNSAEVDSDAQFDFIAEGPA